MPNKNMVLALPLLLASAVVYAFPNANANSDLAADESRIVSEALKPSPLESNLRVLTDEIGGRVPGTPALHHAVEWGMTAMKVAGATNVHTEDFTIRNSWKEGATSLSVISNTGTEFHVRAVSVAWAPALAESKRVSIVDVGDGTKDEFARAGNITGKLVLVHQKLLKTWDDLSAEDDNAPEIIALALKGKAKAIAFISSRTNDVLYRHTNAVAGEIDRIPMVLVAREDGERIARLLRAGHAMWADLAIPNEIGPAFKSWNVIGEISGSEKPDEFVVLGAHLDSWDLGTGALDNGCNASLVIDSLRAIKDSGLKPARTIRFILFTGEEQGLIGSRAYVKAHRAELDRAAGVVIFDSGTGMTSGFSLGGRNDVMDAFKTLTAPLQEFGVTTLTTDMTSGTDHFDFMLEGVPTFEANQDEANYMINYHASSDTLDKVDLAQVKKNVAVAATVTYALAALPEKIGPRLNREQIEQHLHATNTDEGLKSAGMWDDWASGNRGREK